MTDQLPAPLVPAEVDLRGLPFIPLHIERLQLSKSWLACKRRPELAYYMLNLWMRAWHELPAASIEDDDDVLADAARADYRTWEKVREAVLRGWVKCSDGRLYHPVVAELAAEAWEHRKGYRERAAKAREAKKQKRFTAETCPAPANDTGPVKASVTEPETGLTSLYKGQGEGQREGESYSEDKSSGPVGPVDPVKQLFDTGVKLLTDAGQKPASARAIIGQLRKAKGDEGALSVVLAAAKASEPVSYIQAAIRHGGPANDAAPRPQADPKTNPQWANY
ncbi:DUF1376 domain-containing protein [Azospirillum formosense]|uniref:DUF1376 domain-containing protein n=1 Tax=Azospirillum formosense TaxID=861533 RepID=UPI00339046DA